MTTTKQKNRLSKEILGMLIFMCFFCNMKAQHLVSNVSAHAVSASESSLKAPVARSFQYQFQIQQVQNRADAKLFSEEARGFLDCVPAYDEKTNSFSFQSDHSFEGVDIHGKLAGMGYVPVYFKNVKQGE